MLPPLRQSACARINRVLAEQMFDAQELIVFRQTIRAAQRTGLDLTEVRRDSDVSNGRVLDFAACDYLSLLTTPSGCAGTKR